MNNNTLLRKIGNKKVIYNTACLKTAEGVDYKTTYSKLLNFVKQTTLEEGCIEFFVVPSHLEKKEFMLWEVWETIDAFHNHMKEAHTKEMLSKGLIELKWHDLVDSSQL